MINKRPAAFHALMQRIASSRAGSWLYARTLHHLDPLLLKLTGGRATVTSLVAGLPLVMLTARGAKSGVLRTVPLLCIRDQQNPTSFALIASNWGQSSYPAWYFNLKAHPQAHCAIAGQTHAYLAHEASGEEYARFWQYAEQTYLGYQRYKQRLGQQRHIPIMVMTLVQGDMISS